MGRCLAPRQHMRWKHLKVRREKRKTVVKCPKCNTFLLPHVNYPHLLDYKMLGKMCELCNASLCQPALHLVKLNYDLFNMARSFSSHFRYAVSP
jgi:hypothetical protein